MTTKQTVFLAFSIGDSSVSALFSLLAKQLSQKFHVVIFSDKRREFAYPSDAIEVFYWPSPRPTRVKDFRFLLQKIKTYQPQLMLSVFGANNVFAVCGSWKGVPHRIMTHRTISSHFKTTAFKKWRKRWVFGKATEIIANSQATKLDLIASFGVSDHKIEVVPNGVPDPSIDNERDEHLIAYVGRLSEKKGVDVLLKALKLVIQERPEMKLHLMGGSKEDVEKYQRIATELGLKESTVFHGSQPKEKVLELFSRAQFAVVPSLSEGFGFVVIEAFSTKTPVIGSKTGGIKEIVREGKDGLLVPPGNAEALGQTMLKFLNIENATSQFGRQAYQRFLDRFEIQHVVHTFAEHLTHKINA
ncbi:glycosyltransferase family 4 protein [Aureisphaera galaxeae]|uniref:glycosyltransferase family 4 protein n=1 Tax=Aureisphaera galaxeae TaxID=1538023 RepID=UPI00234FDC37|nr:glycosyltransferase family 4 protein [Aureisphaera galaxeae]MDC8006306.1 glycosyltransferase family 4 protein [Aureisphaera galaxeae]